VWPRDPVPRPCSFLERRKLATSALAETFIYSIFSTGCMFLLWHLAATPAVAPFPLTAFWFSVKPSMPTTRGNPRATQRWKRVRKLVLSGVTHCTRCGLPFILGIPRHPRSPSVDHIIPLHLGGDPYALSNLRAVCYGCNSKGGLAIASGRIVRQRPTTAHRW
jgi:hypothetical protein